MIRARSALFILASGMALPSTPWMESRASRADLDQTQKRPRCPPGASWRRFRRETSQSSTPGRLRNACSTPSLEAYTTRGPRRRVYLRLRILPLPARIFLELAAFSTSSMAPTAARASLAAEVFFRDWTESSTTSGISGTSSMRWPRAMTRAGTAEAARAEATAYLFWVVLILRFHFLQVLVGANMRPPRHMLPKAPCPERLVPPPPTRGIRATARPVPQELAETFLPARTETA
mmetsp:Transcript_25378/g.51897  ORF Transcript_25378/g.51897 Transcript_25378/m.51897 type:complete len:234 (-) Transcript_25378:271-972(-)